ncbi:hypothetical protein [Rickettsia akari]|nr:hypothetical protein [Rickettsia akari]
MNQETLQSTPNHLQAITFSENKSILLDSSNSSNFKQFTQMLQADEFYAMALQDSIDFVKNIKITVEVVNYLINDTSKYNAITYYTKCYDKIIY